MSTEHVRLRLAPYACTVDPRGATLRWLTYAGSDLVEPSPGLPDGAFRGALLAPWPNRVGDATYVFDGVEHRLAVNETDRGHALHGLAQALTWDVTEQAPDRVRLDVEVPVAPGWPFRLRLSARYELGADGLTVRLEAVNAGDTRLPYGCGMHPYLVSGAGALDDAELLLPAGTRLETDDRMLLSGTAAVEDVDADFREPTVIGDRFLDHCFTDIGTDVNGDAEAVLSRPGRPGVAIGWGPWARWVQVHTPARAGPDEPPHGLAVEPMSCPPDAFRSGTGLVVLEPGEWHAAWWRIAARLDAMADPPARP